MKNIKVSNLSNLSFIINIAYALGNGVFGFIYKQWWYITLCVYYILLSVMRIALLQMKQKNCGENDTETFAKRFTGAMLILLSVSLIGIVILSAVKDRGIVHHEIIMITIALYTFTKVVLAVISLVKANKHNSPILKSLRNITFADALVSIFSLQRSMLVSFEGMKAGNIKIFNILTGSAVCLVVLILGINLIGGKRIDMAKSKLIKTAEKIANGVAEGYKKIEKGVVDGYTKIEDKFVDQYLTKDGETVEEAKERLKKNK